jgi:hypothetical protein
VQHRPERTVNVWRVKGKRSNDKREVSYHLNDPRRITMVEKRALVDRVVSLLNGTGELFPEAELVYVTMFQRHVDSCCDREGHVTETDVVGLDTGQCEEGCGQGCDGNDG